MARLPGHSPVPPTHVACRGADHLPEWGAGDHAQLPAAAAARAGLDRGARLGAVSAAVLACGHHVVGDGDGGPAGRVGQVDLGCHCHVTPLERAAAGRGAEHVAERARAPEERVEDIGHRAERLEVRRIPAAAKPFVTEAVVGGTAIGVREHLVGLGRLLELLLGLRVVTVHIRVKLTGETPERVLDGRVVGVP